MLRSLDKFVNWVRSKLQLMKITILGFDIWGYVEEIAQFLEKQGHEVHFINATLYQFPHRNLLFKSKNFFAKTFFSRNLKKDQRDAEITNLIKEGQDFILVVNPGEYNNKLLTRMRNSTNILVGWYYDSAKRKKITSFHTRIFDQLLTFDRIDALKREELRFLPNFNYKVKTEISETTFRYKAYTVLNQDYYRLKILDRIITQLKGYPVLVQMKSKPFPGFSKEIQFISEPLSFDEVGENIRNSEIVLDILSKGKYAQKGLSFRVYEAMSYQKKMITNNTDIVNYNFYNPNNFFVIEDVENIVIPKSFMDAKYEPIPDEIYEQYTLESWCKTLLSIPKKRQN